MAHRRAPSKYLFPSPSVANGEEAELKREDFSFERRLGDGAFGQVWKAKHLANNKVYAIKQVPKQNVMTMLPQFKREVLIMYELNHPNIIKLFNHFEDERFFYLILELAEGGTLFSKIFKDKQIMEPVAAQIFWEVATAVEYLHAHEPAIIHRDLKPENVLLDREGKVKLTDFGWSNYFNKEMAIPRTTICGTLEYLPPEIVEETGHGPAMDVWCMGVLLYEMLIGNTPFKANVKSRVLANIASAKPKFSLSFPHLAKDLILKMLVKNPEERLTVPEIKEHAWFKQFSIVKLQETPKLVDIRKVENETPQGYQVIAKPEPSVSTTVRSSSASQNSSETKKDGSSKLGEEDMQYSVSSSSEDGSKSDIFEELTIKENLDKLKAQVASQNEEKYTLKTNLSVKELELNSFQARIKDLQSAIEEKKVYKAYLQKNVEKHSQQVAEKNGEIEKLQLISTPEKLEALTATARNELAEKSAVCAVSAKGLEQLREQYEQLCGEVALKEKVMNELNGKLQKLHQDFKLTRVSLASGLSDVKLNHALMLSRLKGEPRKSVLDVDDQQRADDLIELIRGRVKEIESDSQGITYLRKLIDAQENAIFSREEDINALTAASDRKKLDLRQELQVKMREIKQTQRDSQAKIEQKQREKREKQRKVLTEALQQARDTDFRSFFTAEDYGKIKEMYENLRSRRQTLQQKVDMLLRVRGDLSAKLANLDTQEVALKAQRRR